MGLFDIFKRKKEPEVVEETPVRTVELTEPIYFRVNTNNLVDGYKVGRLDKLIIKGEYPKGLKPYIFDFSHGSYGGNNLHFSEFERNGCPRISYWGNEVSNDKSDLLDYESGKGHFKYRFTLNGDNMIYYLDGSTYVRSINLNDYCQFGLIIFMDSKCNFSNQFGLYKLDSVVNKLYQSDSEAREALDEYTRESLARKLNNL